jgi:endonuclease/exonuclease/phosphatase family metal-dependent hydrolase
VSRFLFLAVWLVTLTARAEQVETFKVLFQNAHNYIAEGTGQGQPKNEREKLALFQVIVEERPDVLLMCEVGGHDQLDEIDEQLRKRGVAYPHREWIEARDDVRHVVMMSRYPVVAREPHDELTYQINGRTLDVQRGFIEADLQVDSDYRIKIYVAHLKSKMSTKNTPFGGSGQAEMRLNEARLLREKVDEDLAANPNVNLLVVGDMNDTPKSKPIQILLRPGLTDMCPLDANGYSGTWYDKRKRRYQRFDYMLLSDGLRREVVEGSVKLRDDKTAKIASDHFSLQAEFQAEDR